MAALGVRGCLQSELAMKMPRPGGTSPSPLFTGPGMGFKTLSCFSPVSGGPPERPVALASRRQEEKEGVFKANAVNWKRRKRRRKVYRVQS